jgi:hypothetical protein
MNQNKTFEIEKFFKALMNKKRQILWVKCDPENSLFHFIQVIKFKGN